MEKDATIANLQAQLAQAHDARHHAEDARKHAEDLLFQANVRITQMETHAMQHPAAPVLSLMKTSTASPMSARGYAPAPTSATFPADTLNSLDTAVNTIASTQDMDALCVRLKAILMHAKQRKVELDHIVQQRKIDELESSLTCPICMDQKKNVSLVPCGHALCRVCADAVSARGNRRCPICREEVRQTNQIFL
jgi:hypothetical protein